MERAIRDIFLEYSRDFGWMEDAVGPNGIWLEVPGMIPWHVKAGIETLCYEDTTGTFITSKGPFANNI
jgi:hypothetical protein